MRSGVPREEVLNILSVKSRDNSRTPMQWNNKENGGFTTGTPWLSVGESYRSINVEAALRDKDSVFYHYKKLIKLRKEYDLIAYGKYESLSKKHPQVYAYMRSFKEQKLIVLNNFYGENTQFLLPKEINIEGYESKILLSNYEDSPKLNRSTSLRPYESICYLLDRYCSNGACMDSDYQT